MEREQNETQLWEYQYCIINAFRTGKALATAINALSSAGPKMISGHSAGNVVIATAIQDHGMHVDQFWMVDSAIAMEAFDEGEPSKVAMMQPELTPYQIRTWTWKWHSNAQLAAGDGRRLLRWDNRFSAVADKATNFYSSSEDVLRKHEGGTGIPVDEAVVAYLYTGRYAWALQEKLKDRRFVILGQAHGGSSYGGWKLSDNFYDAESEIPRQPTSTEAAGLTDGQLLTNPIFDPGFSISWVYRPPSPNEPSGFLGWKRTVHQYAPPWIEDVTATNEATASAAASNNRAQLLAEMIPARTLPIGANELQVLGDRGNFDMKSLFINDSTKWPRAEAPNLGLEWKHCDVKEVGYPHLYKLFDKMRDIGALDE